MPTRPLSEAKESAVPIKYSGKWVAWNKDRTKIVAAADSFKEIFAIASQQQIDDPVFEKVPRADTVFIGAR